MIVLVTGGSGSGKSEYAEQVVMEFGDCRRYYVATMEVYGQEGRARVERHRRLRQGKGFLTVERPRNLAGLKLSQEGRNAILLECVSNLAANELFGDGQAAAAPDRLKAAENAILCGVLALAGQAEHLVIVTNEAGADGGQYEAETMEYIGLLGRVNCRLAELAHRVVEVVYGIPVILKGAEPI